MAVIWNLPKIHFDFGARAALGAALAELGIDRPLMMTDQGIAACGVFGKVRDAAPGNMALAVFDRVPENPTLAGVEAAHEAYRAGDCNGIVAIGGGSVIDSAKAVSTLACNPGPVTRYARPDGETVTVAAPIIAVPTTAGTGSEVTRGAGIHPDETSVAMGLGGQHALPKIAICDPELTLTLPPHLTAGTGMDALSHCLEAYLSTAVNPPMDAVALDGIRRVVAYIERAVTDGGDREARWNLAMAALEGDMAISKGLGSVHAMANTLGDAGLHHGALVTLSMPAVLRFLEGHVGDRMARLRGAMGLPEDADIAAAVERLNARIGLPANIRELGYPDPDLDALAAECADSFFNAASPRVPTRDQYRILVAQALG